jgi:hypothetical protein
MTVLGQDPGSVMFQSGAARRHLCGHFVDELSIHPFAEGGGDAVYRKKRTGASSMRSLAASSES